MPKIAYNKSHPYLETGPEVWAPSSTGLASSLQTDERKRAEKQNNVIFACRKILDRT